MEDDEVVEEQQDDLELEVEDDSDEAQEPEESTEEVEPSEDEEPDEDEEERVVVIGDQQLEEEEPEAPGWVKKVRKVNRKLESENKRLKKELERRSTAAQAQQAPPPVGEKPTLKSVGYDDKKYVQALDEWVERKKKAEAFEAEQQKRAQQQQARWQERQQRYVQQKQAHGFRDYDEAESMVENTLSVTQQGIIVHAAEDSALVIYALGKNEDKLEELSKIDDPVEFTYKVAKLEAQLKVTSKKAPKPERKVEGGKTGGLSGSGDKTLERLREEAKRTGDYTKVTKYKRQKRAK